MRSLVAVFICLTGSAIALAQTTEFNYQGSLKDNGSPANANYDFEFALFDALSGGNQIGATIPKNTVLVASGVFAVKLDFGSVFPGANRYLEVRVKLSGQPNLTPLTPRQLVNSSPYSLKSLNADAATNATNATTANNATQLGGVAANQYVLTGDSRMSDTRMPTAGSTSYVQNTISPQTSTNFNISGNGSLGGTLSANALTTASIASPGSTLSIPGTNTDLLLISRPTTVSGGFFANSGVSTHSVDPSPSQPTTLSLGTLNATRVNIGGTGTTANPASDAITLGGNTSVGGTLSAVFGLGVLTHRIDTQAAIPLSIGQGNATVINVFKPTTVSGLITASAGINTTTLTAATSIGIGTAAPISQLHLNGNSGSFAMTFTNAANTAGRRGYRLAFDNDRFSFQKADDSGNFAANQVSIEQLTGNVGIGTTAPTSKLHVVGDGVITGNLTVNGTINGISPAGPNFMFGDGSDGDVTIAGATTLTRDMYYHNLTISDFQSLNPGGFRIFVSGTLTLGLGSSIARNGIDGSVGTTRPALSAGTLGGSAGLQTNGNSLGGSGGNGNVEPGLTVAAPTASVGGRGVFRSAIQALSGRSLDGVIVNGGAYGGSGGGSSGPGSGGGGGVVVVAAHTVVLPLGSATITAGGGIGASNGSGSGGGGGGVVVVITTTSQPAGLTLNAIGGSGAGSGGNGGPGFTAWLN